MHRDQTQPLEDAERHQRMLQAAESHLVEAQATLPELQRLVAAVSSTPKQATLTGLPAWIQSLESDIKSLRKLHAELSLPFQTEDSLTTASRRLEPCLASIRHATTHWSVLRRASSLIGVNRTFQASDCEERRDTIAKTDATGSEKTVMHRRIKEQSKTELDVIDGGATWLSIRWINRDRIVRQMTDSGWCWGEHELEDAVDVDEWEDVSLTKQLRKMVACAKRFKHEYRAPKLVLALPSLQRKGDDVDVYLRQLEKLDSTVSIVVHDASSPFLSDAAPTIDDAIQNLAYDQRETLTDTLNIDHTILVDLISDLTHSRLTPQPWQAPTTRAQIEDENIHQPGGVMLRSLIPLLAGHKLVCTREAAEHFHEMLATVGTPTEKQRGKLLVTAGYDDADEPDADVGAAFRALSIHDIPESIQLPIDVLPESERWDINRVADAVSKGELPAVAKEVAERGVGGGTLKSSKLSIYMHGWWSGHTTLTSNKEIKNQMKLWVEAGRTSDDEVGPKIWCLGVTRNLLAKSAEPPKGWTLSTAQDATQVTT